jgi:hypothetical protein
MHTFEKKFEMETDLDQRLLILSNINASSAQIYYLDKNYEITIYDNYTHIHGYLCYHIDNKFDISTQTNIHETFLEFSNSTEI